MTPDTPPPHDPLLTGPLPSEEPAGDSYLPVGPGAESHPSVRALLDRFPEGILRHEYAAGDQAVVWIDPVRTLEILGWLRDDPGHRYDLLVDITAVDYGGGRPLTVVWQLWSIPHRRQLRLKAELPLDGLAVPSVWPLWKSSNWLEREVFDLFGITFEGHPDLRRILMPENYAEGHPLRKDFPLRGRFSREEQTRRALAQDHEADYIPVELEGDREAQLLPGSPEPLRFATNEEEGDGL